MMQIGIISIFPEMFVSLESGITGRALKQQLLAIHHWNPRDFSDNKHGYIDDKPYGGGPGMVMMAEPLLASIEAAKTKLGPQTQCLYVSPQGKPLKQSDIQRLSQASTLLFLNGRYEGIDERVIDLAVDEEWSLGDFVISGGELATMVMIDAITRLLPGALGDATSAAQDSFSDGLLDCPHYTRPQKVGKLVVPQVLLSGNHSRIAAWRMQQALVRTWLRRPDLLESKELSREQRAFLDEFKAEFENRSDS